MPDIVEQKLTELLAQYGLSVATDPRRCEALLRDTLRGQHRREITVLLLALKERVPADIQSLTRSVPSDLLHVQLALRLQDDVGLAEPLARWAVGAWARALTVSVVPGFPPLTTQNPTESQQRSEHIERIFETDKWGIQSHIVVDPGVVAGSGSESNLERQVPDAPAGAILFLRAGEHPLRQPLTLTKPLTLLGAGMERTQVLCDRENHVLRFDSPGRLVARDIGFIHEGSSQATTVLISDGEIVFQRCSFSGAVREEPSGFGGFGLLLIQNASGGLIAECLMENNSTGGMAVTDYAQPTIGRNLFRNNRSCGIYYGGSASGIAAGNTCSDNTEFGLFIDEQAQPALAGNTCRHNGIGIGYGGNAAGRAANNICTGNTTDGISVSGQAQPVLEGNTCQDNKSCGILYGGTASGTATGNTCSGNEYGIYLSENASPILGQNNCFDNRSQQIYIMIPLFWFFVTLGERCRTATSCLEPACARGRSWPVHTWRAF